MDRSFRKEKDGVHITGFQSNYSNWENEGMVTSFFLCILREEVILITQKEVNIEHIQRRTKMLPFRFERNLGIHYIALYGA